MQIEELQKQLEIGEVEFHGICHDCSIPVDILCSINESIEIEIKGGAIYNPRIGIPPTEHQFFKCDKCFQKDKILRNYQLCEVYSRVVGYIRPIRQWNKGKIEEYKQRKEFAVGEIGSKK